MKNSTHAGTIQYRNFPGNKGFPQDFKIFTYNKKKCIINIHNPQKGLKHNIGKYKIF